MSYDLECPYCNAQLNICHDDGFGYDEGKKHKMSCSSCGRYFLFETSISFYYEPSRADCLNGGEHNLKPSITYPRSYTRMVCEDCDYERKITADELAKIDAGIYK